MACHVQLADDNSCRRCAYLLVVLCSLAVPATYAQAQTTLYVDGSATAGANNGTSWCDAFLDLQDALTVATSGDSIVVAVGTHRPDEDAANPSGTNDRDATFQLITGVVILGGHAGCGAPNPDERLFDKSDCTDPHEPGCNSILSGDLSESDTGPFPDFANMAENSFHIVTGTGTLDTAVLDGFTITGANGSRGAAVTNDSGSPTLRNCTIAENIATEHGAGMFNGHGSNPRIINCVFRRNVYNSSVPNSIGNEGACMHNRGTSRPVLINCLFEFNKTLHEGGAIANYVETGNGAPELTLYNCSFRGNVAGSGGAIYSQGNFSGQPVLDLVNCVFVGNRTTGVGLAAVTGSNASVTMRSCTVVSNSGWGVRSNQGTLRNCIVRGNTAGQIGVGSFDISYSNIEGGGGSNGNVDIDPLFVRNPDDGGDGWADDPATSGTDEGANDDYGDLRQRVLPIGSPALRGVDAGSNPEVPLDIHDLDNDGDTTERVPIDCDGNPRFVNDPNTSDTGVPDPPDYPEVVDMGAYEFQLIDCDQNAIADQCDIDCGHPGCAVPDCGGSLDCNGNLIPDQCDIDPTDPDENGEVSADCQPDTIPDECQVSGKVISEWAGGTECILAPGFECWNEASNWCPADVPDNSPSTYNITIGEIGAIVTLDLNPNVNSLELLDGAALEVNSASGSSPRFLASTETVSNSGIIRARDGFRFLLDSADVNQTVTGVIEATGSGSEVRILGRQVTGGTVRGINGGVVTLDGTLVNSIVEGVVVPNGGRGLIANTIDNQGELTVAGIAADPSTLEPTPANAVLQGVAGRVRLTDQDASQLGSIFVSRTLTNSSGHTIEGEGLITGTFTNEGDVVANASGRTLSLLVPGAKVNNGLLLATADGTLDIATQVTGSGALRAEDGTLRVLPDGSAAVVQGSTLNILGFEPPVWEQPNGIVEVGENASIELTGALTIGSSGAYEPIGFDQRSGCAAYALPVSASLIADSVMIQHANFPGDWAGAMFLCSSMSVTTSRDFVVDSADGMAEFCDPAVTPRAAFGGLTPAIVRVRDSAALAVGGNLLLMGSALNPNAGPQVVVDSLVPVTLTGNFDNRSRNPACFEWETGSLTLNGLPAGSSRYAKALAVQNFEVAGQDLGQSASGFDSNFAMGTVRVASGSNVVFVNNEVNTVGNGACEEALYVHNLILESGSTVSFDNCRVYYDTLDDQGGTIQSVGCGDPTIPTVSQWGLAAMALLLLAAGSVVIVRKMRNANAVTERPS